MGRKNDFTVWYISGEKAESERTLILHDDSGHLRIGEDKVEFEGKRTKLSIDRDRIGKISMEPLRFSPRRAVAAYFISLTIWLPLIGIALLVSAAATFILKSWLPVPVCLGMVLLLHAIVFISSYLAGMSVKWIRIGYADENGRQRSSYFYDRSGFEFLGMFGGSKELYERIRD
jgi:hypothetical protein